MTLQQSTAYVRDGRIYTRCSRCLTEHLYIEPTPEEPHGALRALRLGSELIGLVCVGCSLAVETHIASIWPYEEHLPWVREDTGELARGLCRACQSTNSACLVETCCEDCEHG